MTHEHWYYDEHDIRDHTGVPGVGGGSFPVGGIIMWSGLLVNIPAGWVLCDGTAGTPDMRDRFVVGPAAGVDPGGTGGSSSLSHAGTAVGNHVVTQPNAHAAHVFTQPGGHSSHVFTQPGAHAAHVLTQPDAHTTVVAHDHSHDHFTNRFPTSTGAAAGHTADTSMSGVQTVTDERTDVDATSTGSASVAHAGTAVDAHSAHAGGAVDAHSAHAGGAVDAHSAHAGTAVDVHAVTQPSAHADSRPLFFALAFIMKT